MGLSTQIRTPAPRPACTPQVRSLEIGSWRRRWALGCSSLTPSCYLQVPSALASRNHPWIRALGQASPAPWFSSALCE